VLGVLRSGLRWPYGDKRCVVMTHRPAEGRHGETAFSGKPGALLEELGLRRRRRGDPQLPGLQAARSDHGVGGIGTGIPLFGGVALESGPVLEQATSFENGIAQLRYRVQTSP